MIPTSPVGIVTPDLHSLSMPALQAFQGDSAADLASRVPFSAKTDIEVLHKQYIESSQPEKQEPVEDVTPKDPTWGLHETVTEVDSRDAATPDKWVPRHPRLVRLTGRHPFNCEPPLPDLMERGFITPTALREIYALSSCACLHMVLAHTSSNLDGLLHSLLKCSFGCRVCQKSWSSS